MKMSKRKYQSIVTIITIVIAFILLLVANGFATNSIIKKQGVEQLEEVTNHIAVNLNNEILNSNMQIATMAHMYAKIVENEGYSPKDLMEMTKNSSFQNVSFVDQNGNTIDRNGVTWNDQEYEFYKEGMKGKNGSCFVRFEDGTQEKHIIHYAPVIAASGEIMGVLIGYYDQKTMKGMLDVCFYQNQSKAFLCTSQGVIIASNQEDNRENDTIEQFLVNNELLSADKAKELNLNNISYENGVDFSYRGKIGSSQACIRRIRNTDYFVMETFPSETFKMLLCEYERMTRVTILVVILITILFVSKYYARNKKLNKELEKENLKIANVLTGMDRMYDLSVLVDLEKDEYEILHSSKQVQHIMDTGKTYSEFIRDNFQRRYIDGNLFKPLYDVMKPYVISKKLTGGVDEETFDYSFEDNEVHWKRVHFICIERKNDCAVKMLILHRDITNHKNKDHFRKRLPELLFNTSYIAVGLLNLNDGSFRCMDCNLVNGNDIIGKVLNYEQLTIERQMPYIIPEERNRFIENSSMKKVKEILNECSSYDYTINVYTKDKKIKTYAIHYRIYNKTLNLILYAAEDISEQENYDKLTGCYNELGFIRNAKGIMKEYETDQGYALLHFNLNGFKSYNEQYGYDKGDVLLKETVRNLSASSMHPLAISRYMADHFNLLIPKERLDLEEVTRLCKQYQVNEEKNIYMTCGIRIFDQNISDVRAVCDQAKLAEERVRSDNSVTPYGLFNEEMITQYKQRYEVLLNLDKALSAEQFHVFFQPIFDTKTRKVVSAEALVRWIDPDKGVISPGVFIPALEENGKIFELDFYMEKKVQKFLEKRNQKGQKIVPVSVNLSRYDVVNESAMKLLLKQIEKINFPSNYLRFEVTESGLIDLPMNQSNIIEEFSKRGHEILIDDFGSGYSSFASLTEHKYDIIKLDMLFVKNIGKNKASDEAIVSILEFAHKLNIRMIAEGVETEEQYQFLLTHNCDYIQGYYFSKPLPKSEFEELLDSYEES